MTLPDQCFMFNTSKKAGIMKRQSFLSINPVNPDSDKWWMPVSAALRLAPGEECAK